MRLLDRVAASDTPFHLAHASLSPTTLKVTGASDFSAAVSACELRFVLEDDLTRASAQLAFARGSRLSGCLDLLRFPAMCIWVEWNDAVHHRVLLETSTVSEPDSEAVGRQVGVLVHGSQDGQCAVVRSFWAHQHLDSSHEPVVSPVETHVDLRGMQAAGSTLDMMFHGGFAQLTDSVDSAMDHLMNHVRFRFDEPWSTYYRAAASRPEVRNAVIRDSLKAVARDMPLFLGFLLLLSAHGATRFSSISRHAVNRTRSANGSKPLLDHMKVQLSINPTLNLSQSWATAQRNSRRLHQVQGQLLRRAGRVFWRLPLGRDNFVHKRANTGTVCLDF